MPTAARSKETLTQSESRSVRFAYGKALRKRVPRSSHSAWTAPRDRPNPIDLLEERDRGRIPMLLPIRYARMAASPFGFLRGAAATMAWDLSHTPTTGLRVQLCGDAHLSNFGVFGTPERDRVFDLNDFDETLAGAWEWDVKRLATSIVVAGRCNHYGRSEIRDTVRATVREYRKLMGSFAGMRYIDIWYSHLGVGGPPLPKGRTLRRVFGRAATEALRKSSLQAFPRMAKTDGGRLRIRDDPPLIHHYSDIAADELSRSMYDRYRSTLTPEKRMLLDRYHVADVAQKVVGVGSVGLACSVLLLLGDQDVQDPLFLQVKQATSSVLEPYFGRSPFANHAERVVEGQRLVQEASDVFLGWSRMGGRDFYVRQAWDMKFSFDISTLGPREFEGQAELCGAALARAHARTGDPAALAGYLGTGPLFDEAIATFAERYADQTEQDHAALVRAVRSGRLPASES